MERGILVKIVVLGAGGFGTALAVTLHAAGHTVSLWAHRKESLDAIRARGENHRLLPGVAVSPAIELTDRLDAVPEAELVLLAVPSYAVRETCQKLSPHLSGGQVLVNVAKGFEAESGKRLSQVIAEECPGHPVVVLSGPSHAEELARGVPTTLVAASADLSAAEMVQDCCSNERLRVYVNSDVIGVELGGALKNIIAVCTGICDGLGLGDNSKAALMTRGIAEISRLGTAMGASVETFAGLSGVGDLIVTCTSMHSRNRRCGILIGEGHSAKEAQQLVGSTVEGCRACLAADRLALQYGVEMPIVHTLERVLEGTLDIHSCAALLMGRPTRHEAEENWVQRGRKRC